MDKKIKLKIGVIVENNKGEIFLQKEKFSGNIDHLWNIITGSFEEKDHSFTNAAIRECQEEANMDVDLTGIFKILTVDKDHSYKVYIIFTAKPLSNHSISDNSIQGKFGESIIEQRWFTKMEIREMKEEKFVTSTLGKAIVTYANDDKFTPLPLEIILPLKNETYH